jgi:hypothetical protein
MPNTRHIDAESALDLLEGRSSDPERHALRRHLAECDACRKASGTWAMFLDVLSHPRLEEAPPHVIRRAGDIFRPPGQRRQTFFQTLAHLVSDSWAAPALAGIRGGSEVRHLRLSASELDIHARIAYRETGISVWGQLLDWNGEILEDGFDVVVTDEEGIELHSTSADQFGEFSFEGIGLGGRTVILKLPHGRQIRWMVPSRGEES